ncbi:radical SAM additional 4Fe4S-binding SPASM domain-containing protein [Oscillibacter sp. 1-3]|nr:radical SAM additional 4Fe4S-binding SPASM domain-containing protein [Oscillibacter sp. 1-3]
MNSLMIRCYKESGYFVCFDLESGQMLRGSMTGEEPFWNRRGPELLDISITNYCERNCDFCYRETSSNGTFMPLEQYTKIIAQAETAGVLQVALGGGNPNQHPDFVSILEVTRKHHIIPSYTTNGQGMTDEIYNATKCYCGAMAVSWYEPYSEATQVIKNCQERDIKVNIHYLLHRNNIRVATEMLRRPPAFLQQVNAIVFLNYKPVRSPRSLCLMDTCELDDFLSAVQVFRGCKIGFDSCMISYLAKIEAALAVSTIDFCEAGRFSAFISESGNMYPCSFMCDGDTAGIDLNLISLEDAWRYGDSLQKMRHRLSGPSRQKYPIEDCKKCDQFSMCHGGCPIFPINRCGGREKDATAFSG